MWTEWVPSKDSISIYPPSFFYFYAFWSISSSSSARSQVFLTSFTLLLLHSRNQKSIALAIIHFLLFLCGKERETILSLSHTPAPHSERRTGTNHCQFLLVHQKKERYNTPQPTKSIPPNPDSSIQVDLRRSDSAGGRPLSTSAGRLRSSLSCQLGNIYSAGLAVFATDNTPRICVFFPITLA